MVFEIRSHAERIVVQDDWRRVAREDHHPVESDFHVGVLVDQWCPARANDVGVGFINVVSQLAY